MSAAGRMVIAAAIAIGMVACSENAPEELRERTGEAYGRGEYEADQDEHAADTLPEQFPEGLPEAGEPSRSPQSAPYQDDENIGRLDPDLPADDPSPFAGQRIDPGPGPLSGPGGPMGERGFSGPVHNESEEQ